MCSINSAYAADNCRERRNEKRPSADNEEARDKDREKNVAAERGTRRWASRVYGPILGSSHSKMQRRDSNVTQFKILLPLLYKLMQFCRQNLSVRP